MRIQPGLFRFLMRQTLPATLVGGLALAVYVLVDGDVLSPVGIGTLIMLATCLTIAWLLGRVRSGSFAFVYTRGATRDVIWRHKMLASVASLLLAWLPATLMVWLHLRSWVQDVVFRSPNSPVMAPLETLVPLWWLMAAALVLPGLHYAWIRLAQPTAGSRSGLFVAAAVLALVPASLGFIRPGWGAWDWRKVAILLLCFVMAGALLLAGWRLHRQMEVRG